MDHRIPVGVLYKETEHSPYLVLGLAVPTEFKQSYFLFESYKSGTSGPADQSDAFGRSEVWRPHSAGRFADAEMRVAVESHAVKLASDYYRDQGYEVTEVGKPYDLLAVKGSEELHVEVKGSTMSVGDVELTINEVRHAREIPTDLYVVDQIRLERLNDETLRTSGGRVRHWPSWTPADTSLSPTRYRYQLPGWLQCLDTQSDGKIAAKEAWRVGEPMGWISLVATALGAIIAFSGSTLSESIKHKREESRGQIQAKHQISIDFILAANSAHSRLREVTSKTLEVSQLPTAARDAVGSSGIYDAREQVLISAPPEMVLAAERTFQSVIIIRDIVSDGSKLDSPSYRQAFNAFAQAIWTFRQAVRVELGIATLDLDEMIQVETNRRVKQSDIGSDNSGRDS